MQTQTGENTQVAEAPTFEKVWAMMQETDRRIQEIWEKQEKRQAELNRQLSDLGSRFGEMVEYMVVPNLMEKFGELGFEFTRAYQRDVLKDENKNFITEVDITLVDGDKVMLVEVKSKPTTQDIKEHLKRMKKVRAYVDKRDDKRKYYGAIAGMVINDNERKYALKSGFYVIEPSGETFSITVPEGDFSVRIW